MKNHVKAFIFAFMLLAAVAGVRAQPGSRIDGETDKVISTWVEKSNATQLTLRLSLTAKGTSDALLSFVTWKGSGTDAKFGVIVQVVTPKGISYPATGTLLFRGGSTEAATLTLDSRVSSMKDTADNDVFHSFGGFADLAFIDKLAAVKGDIVFTHGPSTFTIAAGSSQKLLDLKAAVMQK